MILGTPLATAAYVYTQKPILFDSWFGVKHKKASAIEDQYVIDEKQYGQNVKAMMYRLQKSDLKICYDQYLNSTPNTEEGAVQYSWYIDSSGKLNDLNMIHTDFSNTLFEDCITRNVEKLSFSQPPNTHGILVRHKFQFKKRELAEVVFSKEERSHQ